MPTLRRRLDERLSNRVLEGGTKRRHRSAAPDHGLSLSVTRHGLEVRGSLDWRSVLRVLAGAAAGGGLWLMTRYFLGQ
jgi:hypothetical protein